MNKIESIIQDIEMMRQHLIEANKHYENVGKGVQAEIKSESENGSTHVGMTTTEKEIYTMILHGLNLEVIAGQRHTSPRTVEKQRDMIRKKLGFKRLKEFHQFVEEKRVE